MGIGRWLVGVTPGLLADVGRALYGDRWQTSLARSLGVHVDTIRHWLTGRRGMPSSLAGELAGLLDKRRAEIEAVRAKVG